MSMSRFEGPMQANISEEVAASLAESGRRLRRALDLLAEYDRSTTEPSKLRTTRLALVDEAAEKLWGYVVQRELIGLNDADYIREQYEVPHDVWRRMGPKGAHRSRDH
ncbi:MAG: hypothetical protein ACJ8MH_08130 [Povalibacter sp.]